MFHVVSDQPLAEEVVVNEDDALGEDGAFDKEGTAHVLSIFNSFLSRRDEQFPGNLFLYIYMTASYKLKATKQHH